MKIRPMTLTDVESVVDLENQTWTSQNTPAQLPVASKDKILAQFDNPTHYLVAEEKGHIIGVLDYQPYFSFPSGRYIVTFGIAVQAEQRGKGIGRQLVLNFLKTAREEGYKKVIIHVLSENNTACAFYEALGFQLEAQLKKLFYLGEVIADDLIYSLNLEEYYA